MNHLCLKKKIYRKSSIHEGTVVDSVLICPDCQRPNLEHNLKNNLYICPACNYHYKMTAQNRIDLLCDKNSFREFNAEYVSSNPLNFTGYEDKISLDRGKTGLNEAIITGEAIIHGQECVIAVMDSGFRMGSMGTVVGEKIYQGAMVACEKRKPFIIVTASGGARMQEGMLSLMQMAKTTLAFEMLRRRRILSFILLTNPTTGGVSASFATLGDILISEPKAVIGFAGKRVIEQTINSELPMDFQTAEFLLDHGHIDLIIERDNQAQSIAQLIHLLWNDYKIDKLMREEEKTDREYKNVSKLLSIDNKINCDPLQNLNLVRKAERPRTSDYITHLFDDYVELHGDRYISEDRAIMTGVGTFEGIPVAIIGHQRGNDLDESISRNFGMPQPSGFRKVARIVEQADQYRRPIITFVDTKGADPTALSEERNQSAAISGCLAAFMKVTVPIITIVIGEGGSGGALALSLGNHILMLENSVYSVISPEGAASILWKDKTRVKEAARNLKITSYDLLDLHIIDDIIPETGANASESIVEQSNIIRIYIRKYLIALHKMAPDQIYEQKVMKYRGIGGK